MANEYLTRTPTSQGNRKVWTWSGWVKRNTLYTSNAGPYLFDAGSSGSQFGGIRFLSDTSNCLDYNNYPGSTTQAIRSQPVYRDVGSWMHVLIAINTTSNTASDRLKMYVNGSRVTDFRSSTYPSINDATSFINSTNTHYIGRSTESSYRYLDGEMFDVFLVDGQALTPDVFGFYKDGDGYISVGSTQATDFKPGQWMPHSSTKIKKDINRRGGFGANGYYLPMNDSSNPGADFHCAPDTIIKLKGEDLPQPRNGAPTTSDAYVSQLRTQTGGLFNDGVVNFGGSPDRNALQDSGNAVNFGTGEFTVEAFVYHSDLPQNSLQYIFMNTSQSNINTFAFAVENDRIVAGIWAGSFSNSTKVEASFPVKTLKTGRWYHYAACRSGNTLRLFIDGKMMVEDTSHTENYNNTSQYGCRVGCEAGAGATVVGYKDIRGFMSNVRVVNGTALYTSDFTPPTEPLTNVTNTVLLCCQSPTSPTAAAVSPGTLSVLTQTGDSPAVAARNELDASIVLAVPGITGGQSSGYGDYSADIRGNGSNKTVTANGNATVASVSSYYGSALSFDGNASTNFNLGNGNNNDFDFGSDDFTIEFWRKRNSISNTESYFTKYDTGETQSFWFGSVSNGRDGFWWYDSNGTHNLLTANDTAVVGQFDHLCAERHHGKVTFYINGVAAAVDAPSSPGNNTAPLNVTTHNVKIGANDDDGGSTYYPFNGEIQDLRVYKGLAKYKGGFDVSKPYTPVGIESWRTVADTCKNNFATLNSLAKNSKFGLSDGNLSFTNSTNNWTGFIGSSHGFRTGKWYWEQRINVSSNYHIFGIMDTEYNHDLADAYFYGLTYQSDGRFYAEINGGSSFSSGNTAATTVGDIVMIAVDMDAKKMWLGINGTWLGSGNPSTGANANWTSTSGSGSFNGDFYTPVFMSYGSSGMTVNFGQNPSFSGGTTAGTNADASGKGLFKYAVPSNFLALCEDNLPTPAIADPGDHFKTVLYTGSLTGEGGRLVSGVGFQPDLIWIKNRSRSGTNGDGTSDHALFDSVRGYNSWLASNTTTAENTNTPTNRLTGAHEDGFSVGYYYVTGYDGDDYVAWCWKAGGAAVPNNDGSITSLVSANQTAGFSIVSYSGVAALDSSTNSGNPWTIAHGLGKKPDFMIFKARSTSQGWYCYHKSLGATKHVVLNTTAAAATETVLFRNTEPTNEFINIGGWDVINRNNQDYIAYCWSEIEGFSKFGSYVGNASADGTFVYCGFKPALVITKRTDGSSSWLIHDSSRDPVNPVMGNLYAHSSDVDGRGSVRVDFVSNGFKHKNADGGAANNYANDYIFMAFAESPFQTANAK